MIKNKYKHIGLNQAERRVLNVNKFGGLDVSNQRFNVANGRALDAQNFYLKDGVIQVREGFEELYDVQPFEYIERDFKTNEKASNFVSVNNPVFNGIWSFVAEDNQRHIVAHIGCLLYEIKNFGTPDIVFEVLSNDTRYESGYLGEQGLVSRRLLYKFKSFRSFAFVGSKKLWFLGGNQYMVIRFTGNGVSIQPVEDNEITFVPKTAIGITYTNAKVSHREALDFPNMLTMYRRNTLLSGTGKEEDSIVKTPFFEYVLDSSLLTKNNEIIGSGLETTPTDEALKSFSKIHLIIRERGEI